MRYRKNGSLLLPVWSTFTTEGVLAKLTKIFNSGRKLLEEVSTMKAPRFHDVIVRFEEVEERAHRALIPLIHLSEVSALDYPDLAEIKDKADALFANYQLDVTLHKGYFVACKKVLAAYGDRLSEESDYVLRRHIASLEISGAQLPAATQSQLRSILVRLGRLENVFQRNVLHASDETIIHVQDIFRVRGIPSDMLAIAKERARLKNMPGYIFCMKQDEATNILETADDRRLRLAVWAAFVTRASTDGDLPQYDNMPYMLQMLRLRKKLADILGLEHYCAYNNKSMMAGGVRQVDSFLTRLAAATRSKAMFEDAELRAFARREHYLRSIQPWDVSYLSRKQREVAYGASQEELRKFFALNAVMLTLSGLTKRLFGCSLRKRNISSWNKSVQFYEVCGKRGHTIGGFYFDPYERPGKSGGAWSMGLLSRNEYHGRMQYPIAALVMNVRPPHDGEPSYISHDDIVTLFHEFGHVLHLMLGKTRFHDSSGFCVEWDAVELPSQLLEQWAWKKDVLHEIAERTQPESVVPEQLLDAVVAGRHYRAGSEYGYRTARALFDWHVHRNPPKDEEELLKYYREASKKAQARQAHWLLRAPHVFHHIFAGGYAAGYYGYLWADSLVADAYAAFKHAGKEGEAAVAKRYVEEILARGSGRVFSDSFSAFRGRSPRIRYLFKHLGLE